MPQWLPGCTRIRETAWCFNPSFTGNAAMAPSSGGILERIEIVSILLLLEMPQWPPVLFIPRSTASVSILLLLEMPQWRRCVAVLGDSFTVFQSFFYWKCRNGTHYRFERFLQLFVSILLLLEMPQWLVRELGDTTDGPGFNPSFTGNAAMAMQAFLEIFLKFIVSILLLLEMPQWLNVVR